MDNSEFEVRAFSNPYDQEQDFLDALNADPARQQLLEEIRALDQRVTRLLNSPTPPANLVERLKSLADEKSESVTSDNVVALNKARFSINQLAIAASLVLALGITYLTIFRDNQPTPAELAFSNQVIDHVYMEQDELSISTSQNFQTVSQVIATVGARMSSDNAVEALAVTFAKPCSILPETSSAHLAIVGSQGAINIIVVNNSPVHAEFSIGDDRFTGVVIPMEDGNLVLIGEKQEQLENYRQLLAENTDWVI